MIQDIKKVIDIIESLKITPSLIKIYYDLEGYDMFEQLNDDDKEKLISIIYDEYISSDTGSLDEFIDVAMSNTQEVLNDDNFDFIAYL